MTANRAQSFLSKKKAHALIFVDKADKCGAGLLPGVCYHPINEARREA
jgi:hypothetical protein